MRSGIVKRIKQHHHIAVANVMYELGYYWHPRNPKRRPTNIEQMLVGLPRETLLVVLHRVEAGQGKEASNAD